MATSAESGTIGRRERKRMEIRDRIYAGAVDLFVAHGFEATSMDRIAERAEVARATVFNHFPQKTSFLSEWGRRRREIVRRNLGADHIERLPAAEQLRRYLAELAAIDVEHRAESVVLVDAAARFGGLLRAPSLDVELAGVVREGVRRGEFRTDVRPDQAGVLLATGYFSTVLRWIGQEPAPFALVEYLEEILTMVLGGLLTPRRA